MDQKNTPLVSVIMPVYNGERYITEAVNSILNQTYSYFELIIINDGSTDNTATILDQFATADGRIHVLTNPKPMGKAGDLAKELGIQHAKGQFIAIMDADDISKPQRLERQLDFLNTHPDIFLCGAWAEYIDGNGSVFLDWKPDTEHTQIVSNLYLKNSIIHPTFFFRNIVRQKPFYETKYTWYNDYYTQLKLIKEGKKLANVPEVLLSYRVSGDSSTQTGIKKKVNEYFQIRKEVAQYGPTRPSLMQRLVVLAQFIGITYLPEKLVLRFHPIFKKTV
ncbi:glycosyltransferase family 2 protein [Spirosoma soli]|uniref:Glycosyltransferase family 2 protein n=1 Tax=Spirosoma soli TaxID=1770529 RepID=A0ABW5M5T8_9BACT